jgi:signal peptidase I
MIGQKKNRVKTRDFKKVVKRRKGAFREYVEMIAEVLIFVFFINAFLVQTQVVPTSSMEDYMLIGDHLLVDKVAYSSSLGKLEQILFPKLKIRRGMLVTFKAPPEPEKHYVKRVIGLPGETIRIDNNRVYINGEALAEPYVYWKESSSFVPAHYPQRKIPEGYYFVMGDNRLVSADSRVWGLLPAAHIIGKPWRIYWSYESTSAEYLTPGILHKVKDLFLTVIRFFGRTRWERTLKKY